MFICITEALLGSSVAIRHIMSGCIFFPQIDYFFYAISEKGKEFIANEKNV